jgi:hypothetical protein
LLLRVAKEVKNVSAFMVRRWTYLQLVSHEYDYARCALQAFRYQERRHLRATATFRHAFWSHCG